MTSFSPFAEMFFAPIALAFMLVYLFGVVQRSDVIETYKTAAMGGIFGCAAILSMTMPITISDGIFVDLRNLFIGISAAYFGYLAGMATLVIAIVMRVHLGGDGVVYALPAMAVAMIMGLVWRKYFWSMGRNNLAALPILGAMISVGLLFGLLLPEPLRQDYIRNVMPVIVVMNMIGAIILGGLLYREMKIAEQSKQMEEAATRDPLTKLMNRRQLEAIVKTMPQPTQTAKGRALIFFDIDEFKTINDTYGHPAGDTALLEVTSRIQKCLRPNDHFARMGGDEFVVILPEATLPEAKMIAERCRDIVASRSVAHQTAEFNISISLGVRWMETPTDFFGHLSAADTALYEAKANGRNRVVYRSCDEAQASKQPFLEKAG